MRRREFLGALSSAAAAWPFAARAQQPVMPVIGALEAINSVSTTVDAFHQGLGDAGFTEGRNVTIERRLAEGHYERLPALAAELVGRQVTVIAATTPVAALAAEATTGTIPIVFSLGSDPVKDVGWSRACNRPGGNITGVTFFNNLLAAKRIELLRDIVPGLSVVGLLLNPANPNAELELNDTEVGARSLGLKLVTVRAATSDQVDAAFAELVRLQATALTIAGDAYLTSRRDQTLALASQHRIATESITIGNRSRLVGLRAMAPTAGKRRANSGAISAVSLRARSPPTCRWCSPANSRWSSISRLRRRSVSRSAASPAARGRGDKW